METAIFSEMALIWGAIFQTAYDILMMNKNRCHCQDRSFLLPCLSEFHFASKYEFILNSVSFGTFCSISSTTSEHIPTIKRTLWSPKFLHSKIQKFEWNKTFVPFIHFIAYLRSSELIIITKLVESTFEIYLLFVTHFWNSLCVHISMAQQRQNEGNEWPTECVDSTFWI